MNNASKTLSSAHLQLRTDVTLRRQVL